LYGYPTGVFQVGHEEILKVHLERYRLTLLVRDALA